MPEFVRLAGFTLSGAGLHIYAGGVERTSGFVRNEDVEFEDIYAGAALLRVDPDSQRG